MPLFFWFFADFISNFASMKREMRILAMLACLMVVCIAIAGNHSSGLPAVAASGDANGSLKQPSRECITVFPAAEAVGVETMPRISVSHTTMSRTSRVQQVRVGGQGTPAGCITRHHAQQRRTASGSLYTFGTSSPVYCTFMKDYYIYMLRRIVI